MMNRKFKVGDPVAVNLPINGQHIKRTAYGRLTKVYRMGEKPKDYTVGLVATDDQVAHFTSSCGLRFIVNVMNPYVVRRITEQELFLKDLKLGGNIEVEPE
jgi:hypothetical protein